MYSSDFSDMYGETGKVRGKMTEKLTTIGERSLSGFSLSQHEIHVVKICDKTEMAKDWYYFYWSKQSYLFFAYCRTHVSDVYIGQTYFLSVMAQRPASVAFRHGKTESFRAFVWRGLFCDFEIKNHPK